MTLPLRWGWVGVVVSWPVRNVRFLIAYDGSRFYGWQRLKDKPTVQGALEAAIEAAFGERVPVLGAGRTDRGAHAQGQVAGFRMTRPVPVGFSLT